MKPALLIVDDHKPIRFAFCRFFTARGWKVDASASAAQALAQLGRRPYRAIVLDLRLDASGELAGLEVAAAAAKLPDPPRLVVVSAYGTEEVVERARALGVCLFLEKPIPLQHLADWLARIDSPDTDLPQIGAGGAT